MGWHALVFPPALALVFPLALGIAFAHEAPKGWSYDWSCCHDQDCKQVEPETVKETPEGFYHRGGFIPRGQEKFSHDGEWHACFDETRGRLICIYVPPRGM